MKAKHKPKEDERLNGKVATNNIIIESLPYLSYGSDADIIPYGIDNMYPERMLKALRKSPTARGCASLFERFVFGQGFAGGDEIIVNRMGETLNAVLSKSVKNYSEMFGMAIHLNFNWMGQIIEMFSVDMDFPRKHKTLDKADLGFWVNGGSNWTNNKVTLDLYGFRNPVTEMKKKGYWQYNGQLFYFSKGDTIYPDSPLDSASVSALYEHESQVYPYANIQNGFSGNTIIKMPSGTTGEKAQPDVDGLQANLSRLHGAKNAGGSVVHPVAVNNDGNPVPFNMVEHLSPTNVDGLFVNQNKKAERDILKVYTMPMTLLGVPDNGMFNEDSYVEAFNYKNADTEPDRQRIEREFRQLLEASVFNIEDPKIIPLAMKEKSSTKVPQQRF